jgi:mercuric ion transport protein
LAALLASSCCLGPLVLLGLGVSGAWIGNLAALEAWRPWFIAVALAALLLAARRIWRPAAACAPGEVCAVPQVRRGYRWAFWAIAGLVGVALVFPWIAPWFH